MSESETNRNHNADAKESGYDIYGPRHRALQAQFEVEKLADRVADIIVKPAISDEQKAFIESRDMFFLSTIDHRGYPTCSYKGGDRGFVQVIDSETLVFPSYDGNGMFLSMGNIEANDKIGMLFIDFETPNRVRLHGTASVRENDPLMSRFPGAQLLVRVALTEIFFNCPRYVHTYKRVASSHYAPRVGHEPPPPQWKRIDAVQDALPERDRTIAEKLGGILSPEEYGALVESGKA